MGTSSTRGRLATLTLVAAAIVVTSGTAAADTRLTRVSKPTPIAAFNGMVTWSDYNPGTKRFRLRYRVNGRTRTASVRPSTRAFDVDLGPDERGRFLAVFSRCTRDDCDLYQYRFSTRRERKLRGVSSERYEERMPTVWGSRIAFVRDRRGERFRLRAGRRDRAGTRAVEGGTREQEGLAQPTGLALQEDRLAFAWNALSAGTEQSVSGCQSPGKVNPDLTEMWLVDIRQQKRDLIGRGCVSPGLFEDPSLTNGALFFSTAGSSRRRLNRLDLASRQHGTANGPGSLDEYVQDGSTSYFLVSRGATNFELRRARTVFGPG